MTVYSPATVASCWSKVDVRGVNECWPWRGSKRADYGEFRLEKTRKKRQAHIVAYELLVGPVPIGMLGCHTCDNPPCCNPRHIFLGTHQDNSDDAVAKHRTRSAPQVGSNNGNARLTESDVQKIKMMIDGGDTNMSIGEEFGVTHSLISRIRRGKSWTHV